MAPAHRFLDEETLEPEIPASRVPQVLTRSVIPSLVTGLDASDVFECYYLTRETILHGLANNTIEITKAALGLRHKEQHQTTAASSHTRGKKRSLSLTLEYGPSRAASNLLHESVPRVIWDDEGVSSVGWENEAKVYYTTEIGSDEYPTANYLASVSGAALSSLLTTAVEYIESDPRHRHYQPFSIVVEHQGEDIKNKQTRLAHGSSDVDFMIALYQHLATLGVALRPVLLPSHHQVRLHATGWDQVQMGKDVPAATIASFYVNLGRCVSAIATKDYSFFTPTPSPTLEPTSSLLSSKAPSAEEGIHQAGGPTIASPPYPSLAPHTRVRDLRDKRHLDGGALAISNEPESLDLNEGVSGNISSIHPSVDPGTIAPRPTPVGPAPAAEDAQKEAAEAAQAAAEAATQAHEAGNEQAAMAAQNAATAAQKAADMTASQQAVIYSEALLSGDGNAMASALARCFSDPLYGMAKIVQANETETQSVTTAYVYWDGSFYLRLNLTAPYISVVPLNMELPQPESHNGFVRGDLVDWTLALAILGFFFVGVLLTLQQILGRNLKVIRPLYKFQRWFFDPLNHTISSTGGSDIDSSERSGGQDFILGEERIPISMGGKLGPFSLMNMFSPDPRAEWVEGKAASVGEVELAVRSDNGGDTSNSLDDQSDDGDYSNTIRDPGSAKRLFRDPDLVELPDLKSKSKIAVPVSFPSSPSLDDTAVGLT
ncbi:hypothetical protein FisN_31Hh090 [Fistulifera solaris]|jgi:hypothetical protein|uniref:Uncharacterized protein n=1 Tax=Fistulifera solaris TaxID=1519565 RepID=A0A1Z5JAU6_FISSO|nr:hypothetical protein FisN_31Hh090 [Fistulifera solaris]|eukprot:GAX10881.1 hypothetical protein FisN_31Hh090 [Fistulifera solaris]